MKKKTKKPIYILLAVFLLAMAIMTEVSRIINESYIPVVDTQTPRRGTLELEAVGRGVVKFGAVSDERIVGELSDKEMYYVEGYFFEKDYVGNIQTGSEVSLSIGGKEVRGILAAKMYNYREDTVDVLILLPEEETYTPGEEVEFMERTKVRYPCTMAREIVYEENGDTYIYVLQERDSITGNITIAVKTQIHIVAANALAVAVSEEFDSSTKVISKGVELEDGMRVRERE